MVLGGLEHRLGCVGVLVVMRFHIVSCGVLYLWGNLDGASAFIVKNMEFGFVPDCLQVSLDAGEGLQHAGLFLEFNWSEKDSVEFLNVSKKKCIPYRCMTSLGTVQ